MSGGIDVEVDVAVVGAGFAGLYALKRLRDIGMSVVVLERGEDVGGTWYWNRYPGARCDIESAYYSYSFSDALQQEWDWTERYATQPEILRYIRHVADRFDLRRDIRFGEDVVAAIFNEPDARWTVETSEGTRIQSRFVVMATGCLSVSKAPELPGLDCFTGELYSTNDWPDEGVDLVGKRVGVIGTGSSGIQIIPLLAEHAEHLTVFQRTPNFSVPARNAPLDPEWWSETKERYPELREQSRWSASGSVPLPGVPVPAMSVAEGERRAIFEERWRIGGMKFLQVFSDTLTDEDANHAASEFIREKIAEIVDDPAVAEMLSPRNHPVGTKRICTDTNYYATFNRSNVRLVDVRTAPLTEITEAGVLAGGSEHPVDVLVLATGFDAMTGALLKPEIRGRGGRLLRDKWRHGPAAYLGIAIEGFPNLFTVTGPGSPSVLSNMVTSIEQHVDWIHDHIRFLTAAGHKVSEVRGDAEERWVRHVNEVAESTLYAHAESWYTGANVPGKPKVFMPYVGGVGEYRRRCEAEAGEGYPGFAFT